MSERVLTSGFVGGTDKTAMQKAFNIAVREAGIEWQHWQAVKKLGSRGNGIAHPDPNVAVDDVLNVLEGDYGIADAVRQLFLLTDGLEDVDDDI